MIAPTYNAPDPKAVAAYLESLGFVGAEDVTKRRLIATEIYKYDAYDAASLKARFGAPVESRAIYGDAHTDLYTYRVRGRGEIEVYPLINRVRLLNN